MTLELQAMRWLRWERRCPIVLTERGPRTWCSGRPDVLGVTCARFCIEIEVKRTLSDFRQDARKFARQARFQFVREAPKLFYYLVPVKLVEPVSKLLPSWSGLLTEGERGIREVFRSPVNRDSKRLSLKECVRLAYLVSNEAISAWEALERRQTCLEEDYQI